jgi:alpha-ketoglutarate-dependent taurine dioxygenase
MACRVSHYPKFDAYGLILFLSITFERIPSDYAILKINELPPTGGDTLWASGYEAYDRLSPAFKKFADGLTATHYQVRLIIMIRVQTEF